MSDDGVTLIDEPDPVIEAPQESLYHRHVAPGDKNPVTVRFDVLPRQIVSGFAFALTGADGF